MPLDKDLLAAAAAAAERHTATERQADMARADYHHAVRQLHLAGATLREIAQALGLSHQRVQQIVQASGGTWWSRVWRGRTVRPDMTCSFCGLPPGEVAKLIAGPHVYICDACVAKMEKALRTRKATGRCSFCGRKSSRDLKLAGEGRHHVCQNCLEQCRRILDARTQPPASVHARG